MLGMLFMTSLPITTVMVPVYKLFVMVKLYDNLAGVVLFMTAANLPYAIWMMKNFMDSVPISLEEAAQIDGAGKLRTFFQIVFPLLKPTTATLVILYALSLWNDYLLPSLILTDKSLYTIPIATKLFQGTYSNDMDLLMAALVMAIIPVIILYIALQKYIIAGVVAGAVKS